MSRKIVINLSTQDVNRARAFYTALGFTVNEEATGENGVCFALSDTVQAMFYVESLFPILTQRAACDTSRFLEGWHSLACNSRAEVDELIQKALKAGGSIFEEAEDHGFMYQHSFLDPDGHGWNLTHTPETP
jgi:predicted lactoylglutathione lyase